MSLDEWRHRAVCRNVEPELFFPAGNWSPQQEAIARAVCSRCPVIQECLDYALAESEWFGMWGGMTTNQRRIERRRRLELEQERLDLLADLELERFGTGVPL